MPSLLHQRTLFVGSPCTDEGTIGLLPQASIDEAAPVLQAAFERRAKQAKSAVHCVERIFQNHIELHFQR